MTDINTGAERAVTVATLEGGILGGVPVVRVDLPGIPQARLTAHTARLLARRLMDADDDVEGVRLEAEVWGEEAAPRAPAAIDGGQGGGRGGGR